MDINALIGKQEVLNKELALCLVEHPSLGMILQHPLVYSVPYCEQMNAYLNISLKIKKEELKKAIDEKEWSSALVLYERPCRIQAFCNLANLMDKKSLIAEFSWVWTDSENIWQNQELIDKVIELLGKDIRKVMSKKDKKVFDNLPGKVMIYRGCNKENENGMSWTLSKEKANWFAKRIRKDGKVLSKEVCKEDILFYTNGRSEQEVVLRSSAPKI